MSLGDILSSFKGAWRAKLVRRQAAIAAHTNLLKRGILPPRESATLLIVMLEHLNDRQGELFRQDFFTLLREKRLARANRKLAL